MSTASSYIVDGTRLRRCLARMGCDVERITGRELVARLAEGQLAVGARVAVLGGGVHAVPTLAGTWAALPLSVSTPPRPNEIAESLFFLQAQRPDIVLLALGCPKQELLADALLSRYVAAYVGVGGAIDTYLGDRRPPGRVVQRLGLEWLSRLAQDPRRLLGRTLKAGIMVSTLELWSRVLVLSRRLIKWN